MTDHAKAAANWWAEYQKREAERKEKTLEEWKPIAKELIASDLEEPIFYEFSGYGDSGGCDEFHGIEKDHPLYEKVEQWCNAFSMCLPDWWNNEGGSGKIVVNPGTGTIEYECFQNVEHQELSERGII